MTKEEMLNLYERKHGRIFIAFIVVMMGIAFGIFELRTYIAQTPSAVLQEEKAKSPLEYLKKYP